MGEDVSVMRVLISPLTDEGYLSCFRSLNHPHLSVLSQILTDGRLLPFREKINCKLHYQEDLTIPGISPFDASSRKQILQILNARIYPPFLPHRQQRLTTRVEYLGLILDRADFMYCALVAIVF